MTTPDDVKLPCAIYGCKQPSQMPASEYCCVHSAIGTKPAGGEFAPSDIDWCRILRSGCPGNECVIEREGAAARIEALAAEISRIKQHDFPRKIEAVTKTFRERAERAEAERDALRKLYKRYASYDSEKLRAFHEACEPERVLAMIDCIKAAKAMRVDIASHEQLTIIGSQAMGYVTPTKWFSAKTFDAALAKVDQN